MKVVAVMPALNEARRVKDAILGVKHHVHEVVVVDDGSRDETALAARGAGAFVLRHAVNCGQGAALKTGNAAALRLGAEIVIHVDADGQHDPASIPALLEPILDGTADVTVGSRFLGIEAEGMPRLRRMVLKAGSAFSAYVLGIPFRITDPQSGMRALSADAVRGIRFSQDQKAHCSEILRLVTHAKWRWKEVPTRIRYSPETLAKGNRTADAFKIVWQLLLGAFQ